LFTSDLVYFVFSLCLGCCHEHVINTSAVNNPMYKIMYYVFGQMLNYLLTRLLNIFFRLVKQSYVNY